MEEQAAKHESSNMQSPISMRRLVVSRSFLELVTAGQELPLF